MKRQRRGRPPRPNRRPDGFAVLADPTRRQIIELLAQGQQPVHEIASAFAMSRPAVSKHLRILKEAGVVTDDHAGRERLYTFQPRALDTAAAWIQTYHQFWGEGLGRLGRLLERVERE